LFFAPPTMTILLLETRGANMAFQFVHMAAYSRKGDDRGRSTNFIFGEARRDPVASVHVPNPAPPVIIFGSSINDVERLHDEQAEAARTLPKQGKERKIRQDQQTLMTVVASHPYTVEEARADFEKRKEVGNWERLTVRWLRQQYGDKLMSVVRHEDENHWHLHAYILPDDKEMRASALHPGHAAKAAIKAAGPREDEDAKALNRRGDQAYKQAMRDWQDSYYESVGTRCGLTRLGPQRRRLTRAEWQAEKVQAQALKTTLERAQEVKSKGEVYIATTKDDAARIAAEAAAVKAEAERQIVAAKAATAAALKAQDRAVAEQRKATAMMSRVRKEAARVQAAAARLQRFPAMLRGIWDSFRKSILQERIRAEVASEVEALRDQAQREEQRASAARAAHQKAELQMRNLRASLQEVGRELTETREELATVRPDERDDDGLRNGRRAQR
jgi:hypothetical protein